MRAACVSHSMQHLSHCSRPWLVPTRVPHMGGRGSTLSLLRLPLLAGQPWAQQCRHLVVSASAPDNGAHQTAAPLPQPASVGPPAPAPESSTDQQLRLSRDSTALQEVSVPEEQAGAQEQLTTTSAPASSGSHQAALNQSVAGAQSGNGTTSSKGEHLGDSEDVQGHYAGDQEEEEGDAGSSDDDGDEDGNAKDTEAGDEDSLQGYGEEVEQAMAHLSAEEKKITRKNVSRALKLMAQLWLGLSHSCSLTLPKLRKVAETVESVVEKVALSRGLTCIKSPGEKHAKLVLSLPPAAPLGTGAPGAGGHGVLATPRYLKSRRFLGWLRAIKRLGPGQEAIFRLKVHESKQRRFPDQVEGVAEKHGLHVTIYPSPTTPVLAIVSRDPLPQHRPEWESLLHLVAPGSYSGTYQGSPSEGGIGRAEAGADESEIQGMKSEEEREERSSADKLAEAGDVEEVWDNLNFRMVKRWRLPHPLEVANKLSEVWLGVTPSYTVPHIEPPRIVQRFKQMALARNITCVEGPAIPYPDGPAQAPSGDDDNPVTSTKEAEESQGSDASGTGDQESSQAQHSPVAVSSSTGDSGASATGSSEGTQEDATTGAPGSSGEGHEPPAAVGSTRGGSNPDGAAKTTADTEDSNSTSADAINSSSTSSSDSGSTAQDSQPSQPAVSLTFSLPPDAPLGLGAPRNGGRGVVAMPIPIPYTQFLWILRRTSRLAPGQEAIIRVDGDYADQPSHKDFAAQVPAVAKEVGLHARVYPKDGPLYGIISTEPLPKYRPDCDPAVTGTWLDLSLSKKALEMAEASDLTLKELADRVELMDKVEAWEKEEAAAAYANGYWVHAPGVSWVPRPPEVEEYLISRGYFQKPQWELDSQEQKAPEQDSTGDQQGAAAAQEQDEGTGAGEAGAATAGAGEVPPPAPVATGPEAPSPAAAPALPAGANQSEAEEEEGWGVDFWRFSEPSLVMPPPSGTGRSSGKPVTIDIDSREAENAANLAAVIAAREEKDGEADEVVVSIRDVGGYGIGSAASVAQRRQALQEERQRRRRRTEALARASASLKEQQLSKKRLPKYQEMQALRASLPMAEARAEVLRAVRDHQVVIVSSETGSGKSTQVPQYLLEDAITQGKGAEVSIVCTQPRRISATSLARRVAEERLERLGDVVGYRVRLDSMVSRRTRLTFVTPGVLLRQLMVDPQLEDVSHVVIDEVHERNINTDFLLIAMKQLLAARPGLKVILMSATLQSDRFADYFEGRATVVSVKGRTFPVRDLYLEDVLQYSGYMCHPEELRAKAVKRLKEKQEEIAKMLAEAGLVGAQKRSGLLTATSSSGGGSAGGTAWGKEGAAAANDNGDGNGDGDHEPADGRQQGAAADGGGEPPDEVVYKVPKRAWHRGFELRAKDFPDRGTRVMESLQSWLSHNIDKVDPFLVAAAVRYIHANEPEGAVLVMLPGWADISDIHALLTCGTEEYQRLVAGERKLPHERAGQQDRGGWYEGPDSLDQDNSESPVKGNREGAAGGDGKDGKQSTRPAAQFTGLPPPRVVDGMWVLGCHSTLPLSEQQKVFEAPPQGARKVVLATNIAETSITIPDVVYVVDGGRSKQKGYDPVNQLALLQGSWISKASAEQRRGRAGRVRPGSVYRLYPRPFFQACMEAHDIPELQRTALEELCLQICLLELGDPLEFLSRAMDPPDPRAVRNALDLLQEIGALQLVQSPGAAQQQLQIAAGGAAASTSADKGLVYVDQDQQQQQHHQRWSLTSLGHVLAELPLNPRLGKMLVLGAVYGCLGPVLTIAAGMCGRPPWVRTTPEQAEEARAVRTALARHGGDALSDHFALEGAWDQWSKVKQQQGWFMAREWAFSNNLYDRNLRDMSSLRTQLAELLADAGLITPPHVLTTIAKERYQQAAAAVRREHSNKQWLREEEIRRARRRSAAPAGRQATGGYMGGIGGGGWRSWSSAGGGDASNRRTRGGGGSRGGGQGREGGPKRGRHVKALQALPDGGWYDGSDAGPDGGRGKNTDSSPWWQPDRQQRQQPGSAGRGRARGNNSGKGSSRGANTGAGQRRQWTDGRPGAPVQLPPFDLGGYQGDSDMDLFEFDPIPGFSSSRSGYQGGYLPGADLEDLSPLPDLTEEEVAAEVERLHADTWWFKWLKQAGQLPSTHTSSSAAVQQGQQEQDSVAGPWEDAMPLLRNRDLYRAMELHSGNAGDVQLLKGVLVAGMYPQAAIVRLEHQERDGSREIEWVRQRSATKPLGKRDLQPFSFSDMVVSPFMVYNLGGSMLCNRSLYTLEEGRIRTPIPSSSVLAPALTRGARTLPATTGTAAAGDDEERQGSNNDWYAGETAGETAQKEEEEEKKKEGGKDSQEATVEQPPWMGHRWVVYGEKIRLESSILICTATPVPDIAVLLFGGGLNEQAPGHTSPSMLTAYAGMDSLTDWTRTRLRLGADKDALECSSKEMWEVSMRGRLYKWVMPKSHAQALVKLRKEMDEFVQMRLADPAADLSAQAAALTLRVSEVLWAGSEPTYIQEVYVEEDPDEARREKKRRRAQEKKRKKEEKRRQQKRQEA